LELNVALRLVATLESRTVRVPLSRGDHVVGSDPSCQVRLDHPSVSRRHAVIHVSDTSVTIEDLGSSNGTLLGSRRLGCEPVPCGVPLFFGRVAAVLEEIPDGDLDVAIAFPAPVGSMAEAMPPRGGTVIMQPVDRFALEHLPSLLRRAGAGASRFEMAAAVGEALFTTLPSITLEIVERPPEGRDALLFHARANTITAGDLTTVETSGPGTVVRASFERAGFAEAYAPLLDAAAALVELSHLRAVLPPPVRPRRAPPSPPDPASIVPRVRHIYANATKVAAGDVSVLITGESGTGKEVLARYVHAASNRADGPFVALNCAALPRDLLESELFGIERGVATGVDSRPGKFEVADGGTLFLDEIADMAPETQASILRVLQEREVYRLGARDARPARVRIVAATNRDLAPRLADGRFREDLYHRIATWVVDLPPLRQRKADIPALAVHFLSREAARHGRRVSGLSRAALDALCAYTWPGNIRQLEHEMARAVLFMEHDEVLDTSRLAAAISGSGAALQSSTLDGVLAAVERDEILHVLQTLNGDVPAACDRLGVSRATLYRRMKALQITGPAAGFAID
jgi:transcriptional regulator with AAA-type ATPase domain